MELSIRELNELIYCIGIARMNGQLLGTTVADKLEDKLRIELDKRLGWNEELSEKEEWLENRLSEDSFPHYVTNEEADEERGYITQALLDFVDRKGAVSYGELETYYKQITGGSNSFSHILQSLRTPYKNRKTQRYVVKEGKRYTDAKYIIKVANPSNWVVSDYDYRTLNEALYGDN
jgi:hypothetical protein